MSARKETAMTSSLPGVKEAGWPAAIQTLERL